MLQHPVPSWKDLAVGGRNGNCVGWMRYMGWQILVIKKLPKSIYPKNSWDVGRGVKLPPVLRPQGCHWEGLVFP